MAEKISRVILAAAALLLLGAGTAAAQFGANDWYTIPIAASHNVTADVEALVLKGGIDIDAVDSNAGLTALDYTVRFDNAGLAQFLLEHGAHVDAPDRNSNTALHWAAQLGKLDMMRLLIGAKAGVDAQNREGMTPIMMAADAGQPGSVRLLLQKGADAKKQDYTGRDAFGWATGKPAVLQALNQPR